MKTAYSIIYRVFLLFGIYFFPILLYGQTQTIDYPTSKLINEQYDQFVNPNEVLSYGKYFENEYVCDLGHPYFMEDKYQDGDVTFRDQKFSKILIKFNVYTHEVIIKYPRQFKKQTAFIPPIDFISEFTVHGHKFVKLDVESYKDYHFYEEAYVGRLQCYFLWYKKSSPSDHNGRFMTREFTELRHKVYFLMDEGLIEINKKRDFLKLFPDHKKSVNTYLKTNHMKFKNATTEQVALFLEYYEQLEAAILENN